MPFITFKIDDDRSEETFGELAKAVTDAVMATLGSQPQWVTIVFETYARRRWSLGGALQHGSEAVEGSRPFISVKFHKGRQADKKRQVAAGITDAVVSVLGGERDWVTVVFDDYAQEDWAIGGRLQLDRHGPVPPPDPV
ncbi:4-oxalocrotonate tautomerase family enzyme [Nitratireductor aquibiodomus]|uniref:4-oxalocrotonate tautomerase family enzyme n=1 Tax=Nitratireductor aquibiodomus TaxID=204799 RepID=A0A1H4L5B1_9HYPH|nr:tautomerase family protein [Nitratireductor aquibiodomus]SEB65352.1 4-oxalocrotonate tautomerase family enzyme [Nitratireductor aquibiodomus]